ncbi:MAG: TetR/AcrR family transcriptional regulator [Firmicutes bacterium]|nr:TetR/AcrR family transcriptional regulator [Bacillota bacterium]
MDDKRKAILAACRHLLEKSGTVTIDKVAAAAGVAKGTVYLYFENKQELVLQTFLSIIEEITEILDKAADAVKGTSRQRLAAMMDAHYTAVHGKMKFLQNLFGEETESSRRPIQGHTWQLIQALEQVKSRYASVLNEGIAHGEFRPHRVDIVAAAILAMIHNLSAADIFRPMEKQEQVVPELLQLVLQGIVK